MSISGIKKIFLCIAATLPFYAEAENGSVKSGSIKSKELSTIILESGSNPDDSYLYDRHPGVSRKLDWFSDVISDRNDIFLSQSRYDSIADDQSYGRRMLRRSLGKEASRLAQNSEFKSFYNRVSETFKQAQEMIAYRDDIGPALSSSSKGKRTGVKLFSFGFDSSNQLSPTLTILEKVKLSYEPLSDQVFAQVGWDF